MSKAVREMKRHILIVIDHKRNPPPRTRRETALSQCQKFHFKRFDPAQDGF